MMGLILTGVVVLSGVSAQAQDDKVFSFKDTPGQYLDVLRDGKIAGRYMYAYDRSTEEKGIETYKTYLHVFDTEGKAPITKGDGGLYTHHRGIFIGWMKLSCNGKLYDRWHMKGGEQIHRKFTVQEADATHATFTSLVDWTDENGRPLVTEERTMTFRRVPAPVYQSIDFSSKIAAVAGDVELNGDPEHAGVQFRPSDEVRKTTYVFPGQNVDPKEARDLSWIAETIGIKGKLYSVIALNHPDNPKDMKISAHRPYGRFGYFPKTSIKKGESCTFKYRFLVAEGEMLPAEVIQKNCNEFTGRTDPTPQITVKSGDKSEETTKAPKGTKKKDKTK
jgi:hypothetical protein